MPIVASKPNGTAAAILTTILVFVLSGITAPAQAGLLEKGAGILKSISGDKSKEGVDTADIASAFKEALHIGTQNVVNQLGRPDGFNADSAIHIPLPKQLGTVRSALAKVGMSRSLDDLELKLNRAAESATPKAKQLFWNTITAMSFEDVQKIYKGPQDSATQYFQDKMTPALTKEMQPIVTGSLAQVGAIQAYDKVMGQYKTLPFVPDINANLSAYVIEKSLHGIFYYMAKEEAAIREDPLRQSTALLKRVFGK